MEVVFRIVHVVLIIRLKRYNIIYSIFFMNHTLNIYIYVYTRGFRILFFENPLIQFTLIEKII